MPWHIRNNFSSRKIKEECRNRLRYANLALPDQYLVE